LFRDIIPAKSSANVRSARVIVRLKLQSNFTVRSIIEKGAVVSLGENEETLLWGSRIPNARIVTCV